MGKIGHQQKYYLRYIKKENQVWIIRKVMASASIENHDSLTKISDFIPPLFFFYCSPLTERETGSLGKATLQHHEKYIC